MKNCLLFINAICFVINTNAADNQHCFEAGCINATNVIDNSLLTYFSGERKSNSYLNTSSIAKVAAKSMKQCLFKCSHHSKCFSVNYHVNDLLCNLLSDNMYANQTMMVSNSSWEHVSMKSSKCSAKPCFNTSICVPIYNEDSFHCQCNANHTGKFCETLIDINGPSYEFNFEDGLSTNNGTSKDIKMTLIGGKVVRVPDHRGKVLHCNGNSKCVELEKSGDASCFMFDHDKCTSGSTIALWVKIRRVDSKRFPKGSTVIFYSKTVGYYLLYYYPTSTYYIGFYGKKWSRVYILEGINPYKWNHFGIIVGPDDKSFYLLNGDVFPKINMKGMYIDEASTYDNLMGIKNLFFNTNGYQKDSGSFFIDDVTIWNDVGFRYIKDHYKKSK